MALQMLKRSRLVAKNILMANRASAQIPVHQSQRSCLLWNWCWEEHIPLGIG